MQQEKVEVYDLNCSPFFRMGRNVDLCALLGVTRKKMTSLIVQRSSLYYFNESLINGKQRSLAVPIGAMRSVHERLKCLLCRIKLGSYLFSPRRGRSAYSNAGVHVGSDRIFKLDVRQFYPSTTTEHVFQFFLHRMKMAPDVAGRLTKLCTINGRVAFGSPLSPILCALVHDDIFSSAAEICDLRDTEMTLWVDDMTISGDNISRRAMQMITSRIAAKRLKTHKVQELVTRKGVVITGVFVDREQTAPANKSHVKVRDKLNALALCESNAEKVLLIHSLIGIENYQLRVSTGGIRTRLMKRIQWLHNELRRLQAEPIQGPLYPEISH